MIRALLLSLVFLAVLPTANAAPDQVEVTSQEGEVIVFARGITFANYKVKTSKQWILIELDGATFKTDRLSIKDKTISRIETVGGGKHSRLYLEIKKGSPSPEELVPLVKVESTIEGLWVIVPRTITAPEVINEVPKVTAPPTLPNAQPIMSEPTPVPGPTSAPALAPAPALQPIQEKAPIKLAPEEKSSMGNLWIIAAILLAAAGTVAFMKKKQPIPANDARFSIVASKPLDAKTRLVLLSTAKKELLLSVSDNGARLLESWKRETTEPKTQESPLLMEEPAPFARTMRKEPTISLKSDEYSSVDEEPKPSAPKAQEESAAVAGLLKLRKTQASEEQEDPWTRELLSAISKNKVS
jgi:flagellar biogenesis protein FliO